MKSLFISILLLIVIASCDEVSKDNTENEEQLLALVTKNFEYFNGHKWVEMAGMYTETADFRDPSLGTEVVKQTRKQMIEKYTNLNNSFRDINDQIVQIYIAGSNQVVVEFISTGTGVDGHKFKLPICTIFTIENGLITKEFTYYDN